MYDTELNRKISCVVCTISYKHILHSTFKLILLPMGCAELLVSPIPLPLLISAPSVSLANLLKAFSASYSLAGSRTKRRIICSWNTVGVINETERRSI